MMHYHLCRPCGKVFGHEDKESRTSEEFKAAHTCPNCGVVECRPKWNSEGEALTACAGPLSDPELFVAMEDKYGRVMAEILWMTGERA